MAVELELQSLIAANSGAILGIRFLASEYRTGRHRAGWIRWGWKESGTPVIVEYQRLQKFASVRVLLHKKVVAVNLKLDPKTATQKKGFTRDVTKIGCLGTPLRCRPLTAQAPGENGPALGSPWGVPAA
ncbi:hypothetical protein [Streptomyces iconiensis]|uniref:Uncharacterized protein n=1 Tax=Streptomyces iconiensis TaxID=1384038 RepID=A0ABT7A2D6_9ACTN|nr:hypothetical protein [Streptomyces iconiensis]MDJ1135500.1 hypothetical protein [Streptomyces iconiensis]